MIKSLILDWSGRLTNDLPAVIQGLNPFFSYSTSSALTTKHLSDVHFIKVLVILMLSYASAKAGLAVHYGPNSSFPAHAGSEFDFGRLIAGKSCIRTFTLRNNGDETISNISLIGPIYVPEVSFAKLTVTQPKRRSLGAGEETTFTVAASRLPMVDAYRWQESIRLTSSQPASSVELTFVASVYSTPEPPAFFFWSGGAPSLFVDRSEPQGAYPTSTTFGDTLSMFEGTQPATYQWRKNGAVIPGAQSPRLKLQTLGVAQAGSYTLTITNAYGQATSSPAYIVVCSHKNSGTLIVNEGSPLQLQATGIHGPADLHWITSDAHGLTGLHSRVLTFQSYVGGSTSFKLSVGRDEAGVIVADYSVLMRPRPKIFLPTITDPLRVSSSVDLMIPIYVEDTGVPAPILEVTVQGAPSGLKMVQKMAPPDDLHLHPYLAWFLSGQLTKAGFFEPVITARNAAGKAVLRGMRMEVSPFYSWLPGKYTALIDASSHQPLGGKVEMALTNLGTYSGKVTYGATAYPFSGSFQAPEVEPELLTSVATFGSGVPPGIGSIIIGLVTGDGRLTGELQDSSNLTVSQFDGGLTDWSRSPFPRAHVGRYHVSLSRSGPVEASPSTPSGGALGTLTVAPSGIATFSGSLADGTPFLTTATVSDQLQFLFHRSLYLQGRGAFLGQMEFATSVGNTGSAEWIRPPSPHAGSGAQDQRIYPNGFYLGLDGQFSRIRPLLPGEDVLDLPSGDEYNASLLIVALGLDTSRLPQRLHISPEGKVTVLDDNEINLKVIINRATGTFSGSFTLTDPNPYNPSTNLQRLIIFRGLLLPDFRFGDARFVVPQLPDPGASSPTTIASSPIAGGMLRIY